jgi:hypothetical protein
MNQLREAAGLIAIAALLSVLSPASAFATWLLDGTPVCTATQDQQLPQIAQDGTGGVIIAWQDWRNWNYDVYAQRMAPGGDPLWTIDGVAVGVVLGDQVLPWIASDGAGGALIVWADADLSGVIAQRLSPGGNPSWPQNGVLVCSGAGTPETFPRCVPDGKGGAIITWQDIRDGEYHDVYAQRVDASGSVRWTTNGVNVSAAELSAMHPQLVSDGAGGAIVTWLGSGIHAQRVDSLGNKQWGDQGVTIRPGTEGGGDTPRIVSDGAGGAVISWMSSPNGHDGIFAQRVSPAGSLLWTENGVGLCVGSQIVSKPAIASDGAGGAIVTWQDSRRYWPEWDVYARRVDSDGTVLWTDEGVAICTVDGPQVDLQIAPDGAGGAIITWEDQRAGSDIYSQRVNANGTPLWTENGIAICTASNYQSVPQIASDGSGGAISTWCDYRDPATGVHIYAQRIGAGGGVVEVSAPVSPTMGQMLVQNAPNPFGSGTALRFYLPSAGQARLSIYDVSGRLVRVLVDGELPAGGHEAIWDGRDASGRGMGSGTYFARLLANGRGETVRIGLVR